MDLCSWWWCPETLKQQQIAMLFFWPHVLNWCCLSLVMVSPSNAIKETRNVSSVPKLLVHSGPKKRMESRIKRIIIKTKKGPRKYMKNGIPALSVCVGKSQFPISLESFFLFLLLQKKEEKETKRCISLIGSLGYHNFPKRLFIWSYAGILEMEVYSFWRLLAHYDISSHLG
jgi:hypothetical protein